MPGNIFIDTNIIIYALGHTSNKAQLAAPLFVASPFISTQVLSETANVASKRLMLPVSEVRKLMSFLEKMCRVEIISLVTIHAALDLRERYNFSWYDSLIVAAALGVDCDTLYSEDMQNGQEIEGRLRIVNPFV
jgi:predicted nucleic acid-binding protein